MTGSVLDRRRLAVVLLAPVFVVAVITVVVSLVTLANLGSGDLGRTDAGLARVGDGLALVVVTGDGQEAATRSSVFVWGVVAPVLALVPAGALAWSISGRVTRTVAAAAAEVAAADVERQSRLQEVVHELRTPLAVMGTNLELASAKSGDDPASGRYIEAAGRAMTRMARTVDDLAGHGRLTVAPDQGPVDIAMIAEAAVGEHSGPASARGVRLVLAGAGPVVVGSVDAAAVRTTLGNFLSNAVRHAPGGSEIEVDWGGHLGWAWVAVSDQGAGLAPGFHARCFERGWQGSHERDRARSDGGAGLGLTIARQLTEAQGGAVTMTSEEGGGATFTLWLPLELDARRSDVVAPDQVHPAASPWLRDHAIA